jgi:hypothetical protein
MRFSVAFNKARHKQMAEDLRASMNTSDRTVFACAKEVEAQSWLEKEIGSQYPTVDRADFALSDPQSGEPLSEHNRLAPRYLAESARGSMAYMKAHGALEEAGISWDSVNATADSKAQWTEKVHIDAMKRMVANIDANQLGTALVEANKLLKPYELHFSVRKNGSVVIAEGNDAVWVLSEPKGRQTSKAEQIRV